MNMVVAGPPLKRAAATSRSSDRHDFAAKLPLFQQAKAGNLAAQHKIIVAYQGFLAMIARKFVSPSCPIFVDLVQEGNVALIKALKNFDLARGTAFTTYAYLPVLKAMVLIVCSEFRPVPVTKYASQEAYKLAKAEDTLRKELGRAPSEEELANFVGAKAGKVRRLKTLPVTAPVYTDKKTKELPDKSPLEFSHKSPLPFPTEFVLMRERRELLNQAFADLLKIKGQIRDKARNIVI